MSLASGARRPSRSTSTRSTSTRSPSAKLERRPLDYAAHPRPSQLRAIPSRAAARSDLGCRDPGASLSFGTGRTSKQGPNHQQLPPRVALTGTKTPNIRTFVHELSDDERASIGKQIADAFYGAAGRHPAASTGLEPTRVTVAGGSMLDALGCTKQDTRSRCPDCNGSGVLAGFGFGTSVNAVDRPCPCSPPKDEGPSEWTVIDRRCTYRGNDGSLYERWNVDVRKGERVRNFGIYASQHDTVVEDLADRRGIDYVVRVKGEHCVDMAIARLLCGLRDGSIAL